MNKCLKITFHGDLPKSFLKSVVQKYAQKLSLEGTVQKVHTDGIITRVIACGTKDAIDDFLDLIYERAVDFEGIEVEPFLKDRDYRGVFRVIE
jgi:acylphosphatase